MPAQPPGEQDLRDHAMRFVRVEGFIVGMLAEAIHSRRFATGQALIRLNQLRALDHRAPVVTAYLHEHPNGLPDAVRALAGALAKRLDNAITTTMDSVRAVFPIVTMDNLEQSSIDATTAAVDRAGTRWTLGRWAEMQTQTTGRTATSMGITDAVGEGGMVNIEVSGCSYCETFAGQATVGSDPLPPFHPGCQCIATRV